MLDVGLERVDEDNSVLIYILDSEDRVGRAREARRML